MGRVLALAIVLAGSSVAADGATIAPSASVATLHATVARFVARGDDARAARIAVAERDLALKSFGRDDARTSRASTDVAQTADATGDLGDAELAYRDAVEEQSDLFRSPRTRDDRSMIDALSDLGTFLMRQQRFKDAEFYVNAAFAVAGHDAHVDRRTALTLFVRCGAVADRLGDRESARKVAFAVVDAPRRMPPPDPALRDAYALLGTNDDEIGAYRDAEGAFARALAIHEPGDDRDTAYAGIVAQAARADFDDATYGKHTARLARAERGFHAAIAIYRRGSRNDYLDQSFAEEQLAEIYGVRHEWDRSVDAFEALLRRMRAVSDKRFPFMSEGDRLAFLSAASVAFDQFYVAAANDRTETGRDTIPEMYDMALWQKGLVLRGIESLRARVASIGDPSIRKLFADIRDERAIIAHAVVTHSRDSGALVSDGDKLNYDEQMLARDLHALGAEPAVTVPTLQQVSRSLGPSDAAVEIVDAGKTYVAFVVARDRHELVLLGPHSLVESAAIAAFRAQLEPGGTPAGQSFYDIVWRPLVPFLAGKKRVYVATDGALDRIPFDPVVDDSGALLVQRYDVRRVVDTGVVARDDPVPATEDAQLFGDPLYDLGSDDARPCSDERASARTGPVRGGPIAPLPCTRVEVRGIAAALESHGLTVATNLGRDASKLRLVAVTGPRIVHLATHGFFLPTTSAEDAPADTSGAAAALADPMLRSGLILAGGGVTWERGGSSLPPIDDGVLTAYEAADLDLQGTQLVVLSACDSGLGATLSGEGVFGLQRGFAEAGARMVMMSLWDVPDLETQELLETFYSDWTATTDPFDALHAAELDERERVIRRYGHDVPKDWAGFILVRME